MTIASGFRCSDGVVLCADSQETIPDYVKYTSRKIVICEHKEFRIAISGAGGADMLEMVFHDIMRKCTCREYSVSALQQVISDVVYETTRKHVLIFPREERPWFQLLAAVQVKGQPLVLSTSQDTVVAEADHFACVGSVAFVHSVVNDLDIRSLPVSVVRHLALYVLKLVKENDPNCGQYSDLVCLYDDGTQQYPKAEYIKLTEAMLWFIEAWAKKIRLQAMAHQASPKTINHLWTHMRQACNLLRKTHAKQTDRHGRLKSQWVQQDSVIIPILVKRQKKKGPNANASDPLSS